MEKQKILIICHDEHTYSMYFVAKKLMNENEVFAFFCGMEGIGEENAFNKNMFRPIVKLLGKDHVFTINNIFKIFKNQWKNLIIDYEYLDMLEKEYTHFKPLRLQILCGQDLSRNFHDRKEYIYSTYEQDSFIIEQNYKHIIKILKYIRPDYILDNEDETLARAVINEVAFKMEIPYISLTAARYDSYCIPTFYLGMEEERYFSNYYKKCLKGDVDIRDASKRLEEYRKRENVTEKKFKGTMTSQNKPVSKIKTLKNIYTVTRYAINISRNTNSVYRSLKGSVLASCSSARWLKIRIERILRRQMLFSKNKYFKYPEKKEKYVYMPLHLIPESTTFVHAPMWVDELSLIKNISKSLPNGWKLYVKDHPAMIGERRLEFYDEVNKLTNASMIAVDYFRNPKEWIMNSKGIITINGSTAFEAAMLGKRSIICGDTCFDMIEGISKIHNINDLPYMIRDFDKALDNTKSCEAYLQAVTHFGEQVNIGGTYNEMAHCIETGEDLPDESSKTIDGMYKIYKRAMSGLERKIS